MAADKTPSQMSDDLRSMVLNLKPKDIGLTNKKSWSRVLTLDIVLHQQIKLTGEEK